MGKHLFQSLPLFLALFLLTACGQEAQAEDPKWQDCRQLYATVLTNSGEDESTARYLSIAQRSQALLPLLEEKAGAFVMNAYNYQAIDDDGSPLYTCNGFGDCPEAIAPNGHTIQVSPNYFRFNPLETADGRDLLSQLVFADDTLNLLVPEQFRPQEAQILQAHRADFYFQKVTAANDYNEMAQIPERLTLTPEDLHLNIIYLKDGQRCFTCRRDCAVQTGNWITDALIQVYTGNIHCNYAHSNLSQWTYVPSQAWSAEAAYGEIASYVEACQAQESLTKLHSAYD